MERGAEHGNRGCLSRAHRAVRNAVMDFRGGKEPARNGFLALHDVFDRALCDEAPAFASCAGTDINHVVRAPDRVFVMLHDKKRVALLRQMIHGVQQNAVIFRMQTDCRLIQHVADTEEVGAELRGEPDTLCFAA